MFGSTMEGGGMRRNLTPSTLPDSAPPDPLLLFIQRAQLVIYYEEDRPGRQLPKREVVSDGDRGSSPEG